MVLPVASLTIGEAIQFQLLNHLPLLAAMRHYRFRSVLICALVTVL